MLQRNPGTVRVGASHERPRLRVVLLVPKTPALQRPRADDEIPAAVEREAELPDPHVARLRRHVEHDPVLHAEPHGTCQ